MAVVVVEFIFYFYAVDESLVTLLGCFTSNVKSFYIWKIKKDII